MILIIYKFLEEYYGGVEAGGTKFVCVIANGPEDILAETRFPTTDPSETIKKTINFFEESIEKYNIRLLSLGVGSFGPIDLDLSSRSLGYITTTPKKGWENTDLIQPIKISELFETILVHF